MPSTANVWKVIVLRVFDSWPWVVWTTCTTTFKANSQQTLCDSNKELWQVNTTGLAVSLCLLPGCGEHLIRTMLARECSAAMQSEDAHQALLEAMQNKFISESTTWRLIPTLSLCMQICQPGTCLWEITIIYGEHRSNKQMLHNLRNELTTGNIANNRIIFTV